MVVRLHGDPVGVLRLAHRDYTAAELAQGIVETFGARILIHLVADGLHGGSATAGLTDLLEIPEECPRRAPPPAMHATVAVCTRGRPDHLSACLDSLLGLDYPVDRLQILVIDNARGNDATERLVRERSPRLHTCRSRVPA